MFEWPTNNDSAPRNLALPLFSISPCPDLSQLLPLLLTSLCPPTVGGQIYPSMSPRGSLLPNSLSDENWNSQCWPGRPGSAWAVSRPLWSPCQTWGRSSGFSEAWRVTSAGILARFVCHLERVDPGGFFSVPSCSLFTEFDWLRERWLHMCPSCLLLKLPECLF